MPFTSNAGVRLHWQEQGSGTPLGAAVWLHHVSGDE